MCIRDSGGPAFDRVLRDVAGAFGGRTAALVADQLEYPVTALELDAYPTVLTGLLARVGILLAAGAAAGLSVRALRHRRRGLKRRHAATVPAHGRSRG